MTPANPDALADALAENDRLRAALANSGGPCAYCNLSREDWAKCQSGFPGCDRADDAMLCPHFGAEMEANDRADTAEARAAQLQAEVGAKDRRIALADRVKAQLEVAQNALAKIDRGGKPMREIAARALLDIVMVPTPEEATALARAATAREGRAHTPASGALKIEEADRDA
ncbi:hypothetical protein [Methylorubrum extorquens]|uniref:hypothetical protein n=1 Tax=Methylorubrum extorquens TaxID=408 RepID=UPI002236F23C|nr:hypothetical protein [Methylorubrum extorquens]UYW33675.1 hypothetical protein OKB92_06215 [Methylorubrum extorquens]